MNSSLHKNVPVYKVLEAKYAETNPELMIALKARTLKGLQQYGKYLYMGDTGYKDAMEELEDAIFYFQAVSDNVITDKLVEIWNEANRRRRAKNGNSIH